MKKTVELERTCMDCGRTFTVKIDKRTKRILSKHWYFGKLKIGIGDWIYGELNPKTGEIEKTIPLHKEIYYRLKDFFKQIFKRYEVVEFWLCQDCVIAHYGKVKKVRARNPAKRYDERIFTPT